MNFQNLFRNRGTVVLFGVAAVLVSLALSLAVLGWPANLVWSVYPGSHGGDDASALSAVRQVMENGFFSSVSDRLGYPFGVDNRVYPPQDVVNVVLIKFLSLFSGDPATVKTWLFIFSFVLAALVMYVVLIKLSVGPWFSFVGSLLFAFLPFHVLAPEHLSLTFYYTIPIGVYYLVRISSEPDFIKKAFYTRGGFAKNAIVIIFAAQTTLYMIAFNLLLIGFGVLVRFLQSGLNKRSAAFLLVPVIFLSGVALNWWPSLYVKATGAVPVSYVEINVRNVGDSEFYAGRLSQLLLPHSSHRSRNLAELSANYYSYIGNNMVNENNRQYLGLISAAAFLLSLLWAASGKTDTLTRRRLFYLGMGNIFLYMWLSIGGFGVLFAYFVSPILRAWNRISIPIGCVSLVFLCLALQAAANRFGRSFKLTATYAATGLLLIFGLWDQTLRTDYYSDQIVNEFKKKRDFYVALNEKLPPGSALYFLPYIPLPYGQEKLGYSQMLANVYAPSFKYSFGTNKGFEGSTYYSWLEKQPLDFQIDTAVKMGFSAFVFYKNAYSNGAAMEAELRSLLGGGPPLYASADGSISVYSLKERGVPSNYDEKLKEHIYDMDFRTTLPPAIVYSGLFGTEYWGRWSDGAETSFKFPFPLPDSFDLELEAYGFANNNNNIRILVGEREYKVVINGSPVKIRITNNGSDTIRFVPPHPASPHDYDWRNPDKRKLGIRFVRMKIIPVDGSPAVADGKKDISIVSVKDSNPSADYREKLKNMAYDLDFKKPLPPSVKYSGMSSAEYWGRWSEGDRTIFKFSESLPSAFTLKITASAFADNKFSPTVILVGDKEFREYLNGGEVILRVDNNSSDTITFIPPRPQSPSELDASNPDTRKLGVGFINLKIIPDAEKNAKEKDAAGS